MQVYQVVVGSTAKDIVGRIVDENGTPIPLGATATARLQGESADLDGFYLNVPCSISNAPLGEITYSAAGLLLLDTDLAALDKATFRCEFLYVDSAGKRDYSEEFDITFLAPPIPNFTLAVTKAGGAGVVTLSPVGVPTATRYPALTVVTLTPSGGTFSAWSGADAADLVTVSGNVRTIVMNEDKAVTATFT